MEKTFTITIKVNMDDLKCSGIEPFVRRLADHCYEACESSLTELQVLDETGRDFEV